MFTGKKGTHSTDPCIVRTSSMKNLGIWVDKYIQFDSRISHICKKVLIGKLMNTSLIKDNFDKHPRITVIASLALSNIYFEIKVRETANATNMQLAQQI